MIVSFKFKNFRSYADDAELSFVAQPGDIESGAVMEVPLEGSENLHLLTAAAIFGANAAGKSNVIHALSALVEMVSDSLWYKASEGLPGWTPFFSLEKRREPIEMSLDFTLGKSRYVYNLKFTRFSIIEEELNRYVAGYPVNLFKRQLEHNMDNNGEIYQFSYGELWHKIGLDLSKQNVLKNQLILSKLATMDADGLQDVAKYVGSLKVMTPDMIQPMGQELNDIAENIFKIKKSKERSPLLDRFRRILQIADLGILWGVMNYHDDSEFQFPPSVSSDIQRAIINDNRWEIRLVHDSGNGDSGVPLLLEYESQGTQALVRFAPRLLQALDEGSFLAYDEISSAIHPAMLKLLVDLFQNPKSNPKGAQLLFTTHDVTIADNDTLRADQIWFVEKKDGKSDLYSAQDFEGVDIRHTPFEKWYRAGRFGALPSFGNVDYIFQTDEKTAEE